MHLDAEFTRFVRDGRPMWLHGPTGRILPVVAGGADDPPDPPDPKPDPKDEFKPITSQEDLNRVIAERVARERSKFSDYKDLKAKADRFDELEAANKSELERATEKAAAAERERDAAAAEALRWKAAAKHGISDEDADLFLTGTDEETLTKQANRLAERSPDRKKSNHVPREGTTTGEPAEEPLRQLTRGLFKTDT